MLRLLKALVESIRTDDHRELTDAIPDFSPTARPIDAQV